MNYYFIQSEEENPDDQWAGLSYTIDLETG
jgi:hypothetical protein